MTNERENDPLVPDIIEQYGRVIDNINNAETPADIPDPIDRDPVEVEPEAPPARDEGPDPDEAEGRQWENEHPDGPF